MAHEALALQFGEHGQRCFDRTFGRAMGVEHDAQIDDVERVEAEIGEIVMHCLGELLGRIGRQPGGITAAAGADLCDDDKIVRVGRQRFADQTIGNMRAIVVAGVDVVHASGHRFAQHGDCRVTVLRRAEHAFTRKLHGSVAEAGDRKVAADAFNVISVSTFSMRKSRTSRAWISTAAMASMKWLR